MINNISRIFSRIEAIENKINHIDNLPIENKFSQIFSKMQNLQQSSQQNLNKRPIFNTNYVNFIPNLNINNVNQKILEAAKSMEGKQYYTNACAIAVNDVLKKVGIDITKQTRGNPAWVPNYAHLGKKITRMQDLKPGDLVIYNNEIGQGGYDHIGIYAGNGYAYNVSSTYGHKWVKTKIGSTFQEGRRLTDL